MDSHGGEHHGKKSRKPYTLTKQRESWSNDEHERFIKALQLYNRDWKKIETYVGTKTVVQIRSHAQKYFQKVMKSGSCVAIPPPRPKKRASEPPLQSQLSSGASDAKHIRLGSSDLHQQLHQQRSAALASAPALKSAACCDSDELNQQQPGRSQQETARSLMSSDAFEASTQLETARALVGGQHLQQVYLFLASMFSNPGTDQAGILQRLEARDRQIICRLMRALTEELVVAPAAAAAPQPAVGVEQQYQQQRQQQQAEQLEAHAADPAAAASHDSQAMAAAAASGGDAAAADSDAAASVPVLTAACANDDRQAQEGALAAAEGTDITAPAAAATVKAAVCAPVENSQEQQAEGVADMLSTQADTSSSEEVKQPVAEGAAATAVASTAVLVAADDGAASAEGESSRPDRSYCDVGEAAITASCQAASEQPLEQLQQQEQPQQHEQQQQQEQQQDEKKVADAAG